MVSFVEDQQADMGTDVDVAMSKSIEEDLGSRDDNLVGRQYL